jgi:hypothetical protein
MLLTVFPVALVDTAILPPEGALPLSLIIEEMSLITFSISPD